VSEGLDSLEYSLFALYLKNPVPLAQDIAFPLRVAASMLNILIAGSESTLVVVFLARI
jgi:hypothetical protein